nr:hypothetical protein [Tanacetum cinerariifolium]
MATLETQLTNEALHKSNCKAAFIVLNTPFEKIFTLMLIKSSQLDGMNAMKKAILRMIRTSDLPMTQNQWLSNTTPDSSDLCTNEFKDDQNADDHEDEHVVLTNLIANLKLDIDKNKKIQKHLRSANASITHELKECKSTLEETNRTLRGV